MKIFLRWYNCRLIKGEVSGIILIVPKMNKRSSSRIIFAWGWNEYVFVIYINYILLSLAFRNCFGYNYNIIKFNFRKARLFMVKLIEVVEFVSGSPQFRITEVFDVDAPLYTYYSQLDMADDLIDIVSNVDNKQVRTQDKVNTLYAGDVIFSLISGNSTIVRKEHEGYLYTQNYVKLIPNENMDAKYLVYLLNEDKSIKKQFLIGLQGSQVLKYTLKQVKELELPELPSIQKQQIIGEVYFNQLRLQALRNRVAESETTLLLAKLGEVSEI